MRGGPEMEPKGNVADKQCMISHNMCTEPTRACLVERQHSMSSDSRTPVSRDYSAPGSPVCYAVLSSEGRRLCMARSQLLSIQQNQPSQKWWYASFATRFPSSNPSHGAVTNRTNTLLTSSPAHSCLFIVEVRSASSLRVSLRRL